MAGRGWHVDILGMAGAEEEGFFAFCFSSFFDE